MCLQSQFYFLRRPGESRKAPLDGRKTRTHHEERRRVLYVNEDLAVLVSPGTSGLVGEETTPVVDKGIEELVLFDDQVGKRGTYGRAEGLVPSALLGLNRPSV